MSAIIDTCTFAAIVNKDNEMHKDFLPVLKWILFDKGKIIIGGKYFDTEILRVSSFNSLIRILSSYGKIYKTDNTLVEKEIIYLEGLCLPKDFDDSHLFALFRVTKCRIFCTIDKRTFKYFKDERIIDKNSKPKIYTNYGHKPNARILRDEYLCDLCLPHIIMARGIANKIYQKLE